MNDDLEQLEYEADELRAEKSEAQILSDYYISELKNITDNEAITATLIRKEIQDRKIAELTKSLAKKTGQILEFNNW